MLLRGIGFGNGFFAMTPKAQVTKVKIDKFDIKIKKFCPSKDTINSEKAFYKSRCLQIIHLIWA